MAAAARLMRSSSSALVLAAVAIAATAGSASAVIDISASTGPVAPAFRGSTNTTWFGWASSFDGTPDNGLIDSPAPTVGTTTAGVNLVQNVAYPLLSGGNNIYASGGPLDVTLTIPTDGVASTGFTTIIIQGRTAFGGFASPLSFTNVGGDAVETVYGTNQAAAAQFFAKYEVPGNASSYSLVITGDANTSLSNLQIDTLWSPTGFAADSAIAPEPASLVALGSFGIGALVRRRRPNA